MAFWRAYVPVAARHARAQREMNKLRRKGKNIQPIQLDGRTIARSFWGKGWCDHLESFSDYANRLPRGRTYVRNGSVCHLEVRPGCIEATVSGSELYNVVIRIKELKAATWKTLKTKCAGQIGSMLELLQGKLSNQVMTIVGNREQGLFPLPGEIDFDCDCPDWASMCKHIAAVLYGVGSRLDSEPDLLFVLRKVEAQELISAEMALPNVQADATGSALADDELGAIFGIDLDTEAETALASEAPAPRARTTRRVAATPTPKQARVAPKRNAVASTKTKSQAAKTTRSAPPQTNAARVIPQPTGKSIARLRQQLGYSVAQMAKQLGVSSASVYRWENISGRLHLQTRPLHELAALRQQIKGDRTPSTPKAKRARA